MTRKTVGYVQLEWTCPRCATRNPGPQKFCNGCGAPQPADVKFEQPAQEKLLTDAGEIARAKAGPDIHCPYCSSRNPGSAKFCGACGGDLKGGEARAKGEVLGAYRPGPAAPVVCPACGASNPAGAARCTQCGASLAAPAAQKAAAPASARPRAAPSNRVLIAIAGVLLVLCLGAAAVLLVRGNQSQTVEARVERLSWSRTLPVEALTEVQREAWQDEVPPEASLGACGLEYRYTQSDPAPNATEVCGTPYTVDSGSGFGEVVQDCEYQVYDEWCSYTALDWQTVDTVTQTGEDGNPFWPEVSLAGDQRLGEGEEVYRVVFSTPDGEVEYAPADATEFLRFEDGSGWLLEINGLGSIVSIEPAD
jgi:hypothetical protein